MTVNVRCGGHSMWCQWAAADGVLIDMRNMHDYAVYPGGVGEPTTVMVQGGATFDEFVPKLERLYSIIVSHGLSPGVGMGGITTGGGWHLFLTPHYGWAVDNIVSFNLVTPGGSLLRVNNTATTILTKSPYEPNLETIIAGNWLNWMARGSWSAFGIITEFVVKAHPYPEPWMEFRVIDPWANLTNLWRVVASPPPSWSCGSFGLGLFGFDDIHAVGCTKLDTSDRRTMRQMLVESGVNTTAELPLSPKLFELCEGRHGGKLLGLGFVMGVDIAPQVINEIETFKECMTGHAFQGGGRFGLQSQTALPWPEKAVFAMVAPAGPECTKKLLQFANSKLQSEWNGKVHVYPNWGDCEIENFGEAYWGDNYPALVDKKNLLDPSHRMGGIQTVGSEAFTTCWAHASPSPNCVTAQASQEKFNQIWDERVKVCKENDHNRTAASTNGTTPCITQRVAGLSFYNNCPGTTHRPEHTSYILSVPPQCMDGGCGLILDVHGGSMNPDWENKNTLLREQGVTHGYIVLNPWNFSPDAQRPDEKDDIDTYNIMHEVIGVYAVDKDRVHMTGFSYGGDQTWRFLFKWADEFASVVPVGACDLVHASQLPETQVSMLHFAGKYDMLVPFRDCEKNVEIMTQGWNMTNVTVVQEDGEHKWTRYVSPLTGTTLEFVQHEYEVGICGAEPYPFIGHCFPGSPDHCGTNVVRDQLAHLSCPGHRNLSFSVGQAAMNFFLSHPRRH
eukprot:TRINITY_DN253_c1_g3_i1.p1 TRINITY_DN253_c1_g3~~TRINITY_DN253_c1_g3_i1.p1  ORF type:complete len:807 (+),score=239.80 TRINITY_DN253_c1_g3_i1:233-2422(+)